MSLHFVGGFVSDWSRVGEGVWAELAQRLGRFALITGEGADEAGVGLARIRGVNVCRVGSTLAEKFDLPPAADDVALELAGQAVLLDCQVLFDPVLELNPLALLRSLSRANGPLVAHWPGTVVGTTALFGEEGRVGFFRQTVGDCLVLRPMPTFFEDETPFTIERLA
jgi:hypothetical protein